jgi:endo-1,4-beta-xylanase
VTVVDTTPPSLTLSLSPTTLWPPNHKFATINATVSATDICDPNPVVRLEAIVSSEPSNGTGDGNTEPDIDGASFGTDDRSFQLRAERQGGGPGRVYTITYSATDASMNGTTAKADVTVPANQGH